MGGRINEFSRSFQSRNGYGRLGKASHLKSINGRAAHLAENFTKIIPYVNTENFEKFSAVPLSAVY